LGAVLAIAATYAYFLLFTEFAFLSLVSSSGHSSPRLVMAFLGAGGLAGSVLAAWVFDEARFPFLLAGGFAACALAAVGSQWSVTAGQLGLLAGFVGLSSGFLPATLASGLGLVLPPARAGLLVGLGTGLAYAVCNIPALFAAPVSVQSRVSVLLALAGLAAALLLRPAARKVSSDSEYTWGASAAWVLVFGLLVWLDSAAFYVIQHRPALQGLTWTGESPLWTNAATHFASALVAGMLLDRGWRRALPLLALAGISCACVLLSLGRAAGAVRVLYTTGVSLYSTLLVWHAARSGRPWFVALLFALAGWLASALGIGMAQDLDGVPLLFVAVASVLVLAVTLFRRPSTALLSVLLLGVLLPAALRANEEDAILRGRQVYIAEGCIHCHSQYVRPGVPEDLERWGPAGDLAALKAQQPPLFGNRRLGPDLANVGNRRSPEWNRLHLRQPRVMMPRSRMPAYDYLFRDGDPRGEDLVAYLGSLGAGTVPLRQAAIQAWQPRAGVEAPGISTSRRLYRELCASCHGEKGRGDGVLAARLVAKPADLQQRPLRFVPSESSGRPRLDLLQRLIKFGLPNSAMAGHEYLQDDELLGLAQLVADLDRNQP
jgi:cytochrome c oxidase cbb3-type subunit 2